MTNWKGILMENILKIVYLYVVFPFWFICLLIYISDMILRLSVKIKEYRKVTYYQIVCILVFTISFFIIFFLLNLINAVITLTMVIFSLCNYILPIFNIKDFKLTVIIKRLLNTIVK